MLRPSDETGNALVEFIAVVLVANVSVLGFALQLTAKESQKVKLELFASQLARAGALGNLDSLAEPLAIDYQLDSPAISQNLCTKPIYCIKVSAGGLSATGVSFE